MVAALVRVAAFQNPEFYQVQAMRLPTYGKPRIISCAELPLRYRGVAWTKPLTCWPRTTSKSI